MKKVILASASPRRKQLMEYLPLELEACVSAGYELEYDEALSFEDNSVAVAAAKAMDVKGRCDGIDYDLIISADTCVICSGRALGKPADEKEAAEMLRLLSGRTHEVITGVCIISKDKTFTFSETTRVSFLHLGEEQIKEYIKTGECADKAGAYGIQGRARIFIKGIEGNYENVMGLPISKIYALLNSQGLL